MIEILDAAAVSLTALHGRRIAILGFGSQGQAQALNLRDSGCAPLIGLRPDSARQSAAAAAGLEVRRIPDVVAAADIVMLLLPDEVHGHVFARDIGPYLRAGAYLGFAHGYSVHYRTLTPAPATNVFLVAPKGIGPMLRAQFERGAGVPALLAVHQDPSGDTRSVAAAYAAALGCARAGLLTTTFREETETDLFSEQAVLCGGLTALIRAGFDTLVAAGYAPEIAYFECLHEVKLIADLIHARGIAGMRALISNTAKFGDVTRGERVIGPAVRATLRQILQEVQSGQFAAEWAAEHAAGQPTLKAAAAHAAADPLEQVGQRMRALQPWLTG